METNAKRIKILARALKTYGVTIEIEKHMPGDGWARHSVSINKWEAIANSMSAADCSHYLQGVFDMLRVQEDERKDAKRAAIEAEAEERTKALAADGKRAELLLLKAQEEQTAFWDALHDLEAELDIEIDGCEDLAEKTVADLLEAD